MGATWAPQIPAWGVSLVLKTIHTLKTTSTEPVRLLTPPQRSGWR